MRVYHGKKNRLDLGKNEMFSKKQTFLFFLFLISLITFLSVYKSAGSVSGMGKSVKSTLQSYYELMKTVNTEYFVLETSTSNTTVYEGLPVIVRTDGGLGNQLFELACAYSVAKQRKSRVYIEKVQYKTESGPENHTSTERTFGLNHFRIPLSKIENNDELKRGGSIFKFRESHIWEKSLPKEKVLMLDDYCTSEIYFKDYRDEIKEMFELDIDENPIRDILKQVSNSSSVAVHVRRGDYLKSQQNRTLSITYQKRAMSWMKKLVDDPIFFVFSDDIEYAKKELGGIDNVVFVDNKKSNLDSLYDFLIMSRCKHNIIANSTFSWWAAYLNKNKNKIVIGPLPRHAPGWNEIHYKDKTVFKYRELIQNSYLYPNDWLSFNPWV